MSTPVYLPREGKARCPNFRRRAAHKAQGRLAIIDFFTAINYNDAMLRLLLPLCIVCCCFAESVSADAERPFDIKSVSVGFENYYKNGLWTPITLEWDSSIPDDYDTHFAIRSSDSDGTPITYHHSSKGKQTRNGTSITLLAKLSRKDDPIQVSVNGGDFKSFDVPPPVNAERPIYLIIGNEDIGLQGAVAELMLREDRRPLLVKVNSLTGMPDKWFGYESIEMVVLTTTNPQMFDGLTAASPPVQALNDWIKLGGKMLLCVGREAEQLLEPEDGILRPFSPGHFDGMTELRSGVPLEHFVNSQRQIFMNGTAEAPFMRVSRFTEPRGIVFVKDGDLPLVLCTAHGLGTIIYFGGDLSERPLNNWRDRIPLVRNIMQWNTEKRSAVDPRAGAMLQLGYNDISGQIRSALDQFEGVRIVPFSVILIILTAYWLAIGLFDWFLVHKVLKRPILTWVTFPIWIVLFCALTYTLAASGRPDTTLKNTLILYDVDEGTGVYRISIWQGVYSPIDQHCNGDLISGTMYGGRIMAPDISDGHFSWFGLPGSGLGGMAPKTVSPPVWQTGSLQKSEVEITDVPIQTRSTKSFFGQYQGNSLDKSNRFFAQLSDMEGIPIGTIEVPDGFQFSLKNSILVYGRWMLELGEIQPGQTINLTRTSPRRDTRDLLIPPKTLENERLRSMATYNPQSTDLEYIVRVMSLHRALGGYESTGLHNAYQPSLDMSDLLTADRVLLLGVIANDWDSNGHNTQFFRQSLPITLTPSSPRLRKERSDPQHGDVLDDPTRPGLLRQDADPRY